MVLKCLVEFKNIKGMNSGYLKIDGNHISIDTKDDLLKVEEIYSRKNSI